jgi:hypothetical protein
MKLLPFDSSRWGESNELCFIFLRSLDGEIFNETSIIRHFIFTILRHLPFRWISRHPVIVERWNCYHSTRLDETNPMSCVSSFWDHLVARYSTKRQVAQYRKYKCRIIDVSLNISPSSDRRKMKHSSLDSSHRDESNGNNFIFLRSLDGEIWFCCAKDRERPVRPGLFWRPITWDRVGPSRTVDHLYSRAIIM